MRKEIYIVTAYRWGKIENHSYNLGVFKNKEKAIRVADSHIEYRGGKYSCIVEECIINHFDETDEDYTKEIYIAKGRENG